MLNRMLIDKPFAGSWPVGTLALLAGLLLAGAPAEAAVITYNRANTWINIPGLVPTYSQAVGDVVITLDTGGGGKVIGGNTAGIGVNTPGTDSSTSFDSILSPEMLTFTFDHPVALLNFVLTGLGAGEYGSYRINGGSVVNTAAAINAFFDPIPVGTGSLVVQSNPDSIYQLVSITVLVPEPAAATILLIGATALHVGRPRRVRV